LSDDLATDQGETKNVAADHAEVVARMTKSLLAWHKSMPPDNGDSYVDKPKRKRTGTKARN